MNGVGARGDQFAQSLEARLLRGNLEYAARIQAQSNQSGDESDI